MQVDLGSSVERQPGRAEAARPPWGTRTQTLSVQGSANGSTFTDLGATQIHLRPGDAGNTVTINFTAATPATCGSHVTANSGWPAGQLSELEVYGAGGHRRHHPPTVPGTLSYTVSGTTITLTWGASTDTGRQRPGRLQRLPQRHADRAPLGTVLTFADTQPATATVSYYVRARDGAGNLSGNSNTVTRTGTATAGLHQRGAGQDGHRDRLDLHLRPGQRQRRQRSPRTGRARRATRRHLTVALGANHAITAVNVKLNPDPAWGTRTQNIQVLGRDQASTALHQPGVGGQLPFDQGNNVVSIPVTATTADVQLRFNSNTGAPSGQVAELEVCGTPAPNPDLASARDLDAGVAERDQRRSPCRPR